MADYKVELDLTAGELVALGYVVMKGYMAAKESEDVCLPDIRTLSDKITALMGGVSPLPVKEETKRIVEL